MIRILTEATAAAAKECYRLRFSRQPDNTYITTTAVLDVLEAEKSMDHFIDSLGVFVPKTKYSYEVEFARSFYAWIFYSTCSAIGSGVPYW